MNYPKGRLFKKSCKCCRSRSQVLQCLFISAGRKKRVARNTIPFWLRFIISMTLASALEEDCPSLKVRAHEVRKVATSLLFKRNCAVHQVLKVGTWSTQLTVSTFYLRDVTHRHLDTFSTVSVVMTQQVV